MASPSTPGIESLSEWLITLFQACLFYSTALSQSISSIQLRATKILDTHLWGSQENYTCVCHSLAAAESQSGLQYAPAPWSFSDRGYFPPNAISRVTLDWEDWEDATLWKVAACKTSSYWCWEGKCFTSCFAPSSTNSIDSRSQLWSWDSSRVP